MITLFFALLFTGCVFAPPDCADNFKRSSNGECQAYELDSHDTGGVSNDTGGVDDEDAFTGSISIDVEADLTGSSLADTCNGDVTLIVVDNELTGIVSCKFNGPFDATLQGQTFEGSLNGTVDSSGMAEGDLELDLDVFGLLESGWSGTASSDHIDGEFVGAMQVPFGATEIPVAFDGSFTAAP
jgi:hypothetical protein